MNELSLNLIFWFVVVGLAGTMLAVPQPVDPWEMPSLVLDRAEVADAIDLDRALAKETPDSDEARALRSLFLEHGRAEANPPYERREYDRRQVQIHEAMTAFTNTHGKGSLAAMRADAVEHAVRLLGEIGFDARDDETGIIGGFTQILEQYGAVRDGVLLAPPLTPRVLYKARWNSVHRLPFAEGFSRIEKQAYWGWLALHAWGKPLQKRREALLAYRDAGGIGSEEAKALFDVLQGRLDEAEAELTQLYESTGQLRLRNNAIGVLHSTLLRRGPP
ncbi:MAG: hypothetical protein ACN4G0_08975 [Polyangiales bacterium]